MRYLAKGDGPLRELNQLRAPMASVLDFFVQQKKELERYRATYGALPDSHEGTVQEVHDRDEEEDGGEESEASEASEASDTKQE